MSFVTTLPAPIKEHLPIVIPGKIVELALEKHYPLFVFQLLNPLTIFQRLGISHL